MGSRGQYESSSRFSNHFEPQYHAVDNISGVKVLQKNGSAMSNVDTEAEYGWRNYEDMLNGVIHETGKTVRQMLSEIADHDLEIEFDIPLPPGAAQTD